MSIQQEVLAMQGWDPGGAEGRVGRLGSGPRTREAKRRQNVLHPARRVEDAKPLTSHRERARSSPAPSMVMRALCQPDTQLSFRGTGGGPGSQESRCQEEEE